MVRKDATFIRLQRINRISKLIAQNIEAGINHKNLITQIQYTIGLTRERAEEYVDLIVEAHKDWIMINDPTGITIKLDST